MGASVPSIALVKRELFGMLRSWRPFGLVAVLVFGATVLSYVLWPREADDIVRAGYVSTALVRTLAWSLFVAALLFVPAYAASSIVLERERSTFDFLRLSLVRPRGIVLAKLINAVAFFLLALLSLAPILATVFFLVGIDTTELLKAVGIVVVTAVSCASAGLLSSALARRTMIAIGLSYVGVLGVLVGPLLMAAVFSVFFFVLVGSRTAFGAIYDIQDVGSPIFALRGVFQGVPMSSYFIHVAFQGAFIVCCLAFTHRLVRRPQRPPKIDQSKPIDDEETLRRRRLGYPFYLIDPLRRKKPIEDRRNPMLVREMRWGLLNRGTTLIRVFYVSSVIYLFAGIIGSVSSQSFESIRGWLMAQIVLTIAVAPALTANALTKEYELGNLDMLRMTLLRPHDLVLGKLLAGAGSVAPLLAAAILSLGPVVILGVREWNIIAMGYVTLFVCTALSLSLSLFASLLSRRTTTALVLTYVSSGIVFIGLWIGMKLLEELYVQDVAIGTTPAGSRLPLHLFSPVMAFQEKAVRYIDGDEWLDWFAGMAVWILVTLTVVGGSIYIFYTRKMRDR